MQVGQPETVEFPGHEAEGALGVGIGDVVEGIDRRQPDSNLVGAPDTGHGFGDLVQKAHPVDLRAAVAVGPEIGVVAQELV